MKQGFNTNIILNNVKDAKAFLRAYLSTCPPVHE